MTNRESELKEEVADLTRRVEALEEALATVENALRQSQRRRLTAADKPAEPRYKPLARTFVLLQKIESGPWKPSQMGMKESEFNRLVNDSADLQAFLRAVLELLLGEDGMARVNLGRSSERGEAMAFATRDRLYRYVARYVNARPQQTDVTFATLNVDVAHILSNSKRGRTDDNDDGSDDDGAERRKDAGRTPKKGRSNEGRPYVGEGTSGTSKVAGTSTRAEESDSEGSD